MTPPLDTFYEDVLIRLKEARESSTVRQVAQVTVREGPRVVIETHYGTGAQRERIRSINMQADRHIEPVDANHSGIVCIVVGMLALVLGGLVYVLDRPAQNVYFVSSNLSFFNSGSLTFGIAGQNLPSFIHVFSFSLITIGLLESTRYLHVALMCLLWTLVNISFEIGQHEIVSEILIGLIPDWFDKLPVLDASKSFFGSGTFDVFDLIGIFSGAICAYLFAIAMGRNKHD